MANEQKRNLAVNAEQGIENIVMFGRTGNGKSATGNSIVGNRVFDSKAKAAGVTRTCESFIVETPEGPKVNVIDTPGLLDLTESADYISKEIVNCLHKATGGLHAVLLVLTVRNRMTKEEEVVLSTLEVLFGNKIVDYLIVVFTGGDLLEDDDEKIEDYLEGCPDFLKRLLEACEQRLVVFNNKTKEDDKKKNQVQELLHLIDMVRKHTNNKPYTEAMYLEIKKETERHMKEQEELEKQNHSDEKFEELTKELELMNAQNLKAMSEMMANTIRMVTEAQEKLAEQREKLAEDRHEKEEKRHQAEMMEALSRMREETRREMEEQMARGQGGCNIL
ncbi:unnamed protein product [Eruca vesicaria subsp. sativa]|uniref:AIG1-type G domain-containing protein n=1 Tax=Eruca vesicaria subsp. sativa TaxID=29727 RepID=A0ABC8L1T7_ERUVS|nr:unnamed protein product [Eruca vesicaria subsp. sativa]